MSQELRQRIASILAAAHQNREPPLTMQGLQRRLGNRSIGRREIAAVVQELVSLRIAYVGSDGVGWLPPSNGRPSQPLEDQ